MNAIFLFLKGMAVGGANVMPGVSGATLAVIFRIYDDLISAVNSIFSNMKESLKFLLPVGLGMVFGILAVGSAVGFFLERFSMQTGGFIAGLMAGSLPFIYSQAKPSIPTKPDIVKYFSISAIAAVLVILLAVFAPESSGEVGEMGFSVGFAAHLFFGGLLAAATMVVPGISGAMILILLGLYPPAIHAISLVREWLLSPTDFAILGEIMVVAAPLGLGIVVGVLAGAKAIAWLLAKFHSATYFAILGLVFGTIFVVFNDPATYQSHAEITAPLVIFTAIAAIFGAATSLLLGKRKD